MTVPGVNLIVAATFLGAIGDIRRFRGARQLTAYLGLDPRVRQSGSGPTRHGKISKQGSAPVRKALVEAAGARSETPARCAPSTNASAPAADTRSRSSPPPAKSSGGSS